MDHWIMQFNTFYRLSHYISSDCYADIVAKCLCKIGGGMALNKKSRRDWTSAVRVVIRW